MGGFYENCSVRHEEARAVADVLRQAGCKAIVTPPRSGWVVVAEAENEASGDPLGDAREDLGTLLSRSLQTVALSVYNHDDSELFYFLFENGQETDAYNSDIESGIAFLEDELAELEEVDEDDLPSVTRKRQYEEERRKLREHPPVGDAAKLCAACNPEASVDAVRSLLTATYADALYRHEGLVQTLGLSPYAVGFGYRYVIEGELPDDLDEGDLLWVK